MTATTTNSTAQPADALAERIFVEGLGAFHLITVYLGVRLGLFRALAQSPGLTAAELAATASIDERYAIEWLQAETYAKLVIADGTDYTAASFTLADGVAATLVEETNPAYAGGMPLALTAVGGASSALLNAYRSGTGVTVDAYGPEMVHAQAAFNRPLFVNELATVWIPQMTGVRARLSDTASPARVADVGCGVGWSAIELAKAFAHLSIDGYDADPEAIEQARRNAREQGVDDRVRFHLVDASSRTYGAGKYDVVFFFECVHDFGRPVEALAAARTSVVPGGTVIVMDERTGDHPQIGDPVETFFALVSATWCLPQSRVVPDSEAPGTVMRAATLESFARRAGWTGIDVLPIKHSFFRFYRLIH